MLTILTVKWRYCQEFINSHDKNRRHIINDTIQFTFGAKHSMPRIKIDPNKIRKLKF
jgi:hypothetical protein